MVDRAIAELTALNKPNWTYYFACASIRPGYHLLMSCGNAVVHVGLDGRTDVLKDEMHSQVHFIAEMFGCVFFFGFGEQPRVFKDGIFVRELEHKFENFTSKGVGCSKKYLYYTCESSNEIIRVDEHLKEEVIPGTEGTSDFVVLKDERLFWITKNGSVVVQYQNGEPKANLKVSAHLENTAICICKLSSQNVLVMGSGKAFFIISPELEIIDSLVLTESVGSSYHMRISKVIPGVDVAILASDRGIFGVAVRKLKITRLPRIDLGQIVYSVSHIAGCWLIVKDKLFTVLKLKYR